MRDLFVQKGIVSEKRAKQVDRELKQERKEAQAQRRSQHEVEAEARALAAKEAEAQALARRAAQAAAQAEREAHEHRFRVRQVLAAGRLGSRGPVPFHARLGSTGRVVRLFLSEGLARDLRAGRAAIAGYPAEDGSLSASVVSLRAAQKLQEIEPGALFHWVTDVAHLSDPAEGFLLRDWESDLGPHRVTDREDLRRFLGSK